MHLYKQKRSGRCHHLIKWLRCNVPVLETSIMNSDKNKKESSQASCSSKGGLLHCL